MRSVCVKPSICAAALVRSHLASPLNGPRSMTGTTTVAVRYGKATFVPHGRVRCAMPMVSSVSSIPQAVVLP